MSRKNIVDLFSGVNCFTKPYFQDEIKLFTVDNNPDFIPTWLGDFEFFDPTEAVKFFHGERVDVLYIGFPCTTFSVASIGAHWGTHDDGSPYRPKSDAAKKAIRMLEHLFNVVIPTLNPRVIIMENPRGVLRKMRLMKRLKRDTVWYCQYGTTAGIKRAKPTDIFTYGLPNWNPRPPCKNGNPDCDHVRAPRGAKTGTQGLKGNTLRSMIPHELCEELANAVREQWKTL